MPKRQSIENQIWCVETIDPYYSHCLTDYKVLNGLEIVAVLLIFEGYIEVIL